ncbi:hypothetical protein JCM10908_001497 [Rhodotorula pacifica]|uniref:uncharacterized protein n=1 Tax=Rhodotorula pacifica TaxID=1495444 RepID=UPI00317A4B5C
MTRPLLQEHPPPIHPLPAKEAHLVRSAVVIPSLPRILNELVQNSIDAKATAVHCTVDLDTWTIRCDDNGVGFSRRDLDQLARGMRYATSKLAYSPSTGTITTTPSSAAEDALARVETYGFRGEALASLHHLATLEIRTRALADPKGQTNELVLREGQCLALGQSAVERANHGASVVVRDVFYKLPVRRRALEKPSALATLLASFRTTLASLALIQPSIAFSLIDTTSFSSSSSSTSMGKTLLSVRPCPTGLLSARWRQLWGPVGVEKVWEFEEDEAEGESLAGARKQEHTCRARGFFALAPAHTKAQQHIYVNSRPLSAAYSPLHKLINALFSASTFAKYATSTATSTSNALLTATQQQQQRRPSERHPVFVLALEVPGRIVDVGLEPEKSVVEFEDPSRIEAFVTSIVNRFLVQQGYTTERPITKAATGSSRARTAPRPASAPLLLGGAHGDAPIRSRSSDGAAGSAPRKRLRTAATSSSIEQQLEAKSTTPSQDWFLTSSTKRRRASVAVEGPIVRSSAPMRQDEEEDEGQEAPIRWQDPQTLIVWEVDPRTGNSRRAEFVPRRRQSDSAVGDREEGNRDRGIDELSGDEGGVHARLRRQGAGGAGIVDRSALLKSCRNGRDDNDSDDAGAQTQSEKMPAWLEAKLSAWHNPIFPSARAENTIPTLPALPIASHLAQSSLREAFPSSKARRGGTTQKEMSAFCQTSTALTAELASIPMAKISSSSSFLPNAASSSQDPSAPVPFSGQSFSRESLARAEYVAQVDRKYLLVKLPESSAAPTTGEEQRTAPQWSSRTRTTLVLVDQHAASERVRVEKFLDATVGAVSRGQEVETRRLGDGPDVEGNKLGSRGGGLERIGIVLGKSEYDLARRYAGVFARWGFSLAIDESASSPADLDSGDGGGNEQAPSSGGYYQIWLESVPELVANRLLKDPQLAQDLVRSFLAHLEQNGPGVAGLDANTLQSRSSRPRESKNAKGAPAGWTAAIKDAPPVLVELLNSKACRGAIMFNDELTPAQAEALLAKLARTIYPFQCAHGRPSVVPVVNLATPPSLPVGGARHGGIDWARLL